MRRIDQSSKNYEFLSNDHGEYSYSWRVELFQILRNPRHFAQSIAKIPSIEQEVQGISQTLSSLQKSSDTSHPHFPEIFTDESLVKHQTVGLVSDHFNTPFAMPDTLGMSKDPAIIAAAHDDKLPLPPAEQREMYHGDRHFEHWITGRRDMSLALQGMHDIPDNPFILEFGGATGRVIRHAENLLGRPCRRVIADVNERHVLWSNYHLSPQIKAIKSGYSPPLPFSDNSVDIFTAFSVFTHIFEYETAWLFEIQRILKPGGWFYATIHDQNTWSNLEASPFTWALDMPEVKAMRSEMPSLKSRIQITWGIRNGTRITDVFHHHDYIRNVWTEWFDLVSIVPQNHNHQTGVLLRARTPSAKPRRKPR